MKRRLSNSAVLRGRFNERVLSESETEEGAPREAPAGKKELSGAELSAMYTNVIRLCQAKRLNEATAWGLPLIDNMTAVVDAKGEQENGQKLDFMTAGNTLDASAMIYSARVDSLYKTAFEVLGGLSSANGEADVADVEEGIDSDLEEGAEMGDERDDARKRDERKKAKKNSAVQTLCANESIVVRGMELTSENDFLFHRMTQTLNKGGCKSLILNNVNATDGYFVSLEPVESVPESQIEKAEDEVKTIETKTLVSMLNLQGRRTFKDMVICPLYHDFSFTGTKKEEEVEEPSALDMTVMPPEEIAEEVKEEVDEEDTNADNVANTPVMYDDVDDGEDNPFAINETMMGNYDTQCTQDLDMTLAFPPEATAQRPEFTFFDQRMMKNWAGPEHWKFPTKQKRPAKTAEGGNDGEAAPAAKKQKKKTEEFIIDFSAPAKIDRKLFEPPAKASTILSDAALKKHTPEATTLPPDVHYDISMLSKLFLNPEWRLTERKRATLRLGGVPASASGSFGQEGQAMASQEWYEYNNPSQDPDTEAEGDDFGVFGMPEDAAGDASFDESAFENVASTQPGQYTFNGELVQAPTQPQKIEINYAKVIKRMDVAAVKKGLWSALHTGVDENAERDPSLPGIPLLSFSEAIRLLPQQLPANIAGELSVAFCFVCLLHLCNEKGLIVKLVFDPTEQRHEEVYVYKPL